MRGFLPTAVRDLGIGVLGAALWWAEGGGTGLAVAAGVVTAVVGFRLHEWGHLAGAVAAGARVAPTPPSSIFLFRFDVSRNRRRHFLAMSEGGYAGSVVGLIAIVALVPWDRLAGWVALVLGAAGVVATLALELPTYLAVRRGAPLPSKGPVYYR